MAEVSFERPTKVPPLGATAKRALVPTGIDLIIDVPSRQDRDALEDKALNCLLLGQAVVVGGALLVAIPLIAWFA